MKKGDPDLLPISDLERKRSGTVSNSTNQQKEQISHADSDTETEIEEPLKKKQKQNSPTTTTSKWICDACTLENDESNSKCEACGNAKKSTTNSTKNESKQSNQTKQITSSNSLKNSANIDHSNPTESSSLKNNNNNSNPTTKNNENNKTTTTNNNKTTPSNNNNKSNAHDWIEADLISPKEIGDGNMHCRGLILKTTKIEPSINKFFDILGERTNFDSDDLPYLSTNSFFATRADPMIKFIEKSGEGLMSDRHPTPNIDCPGGNTGGKIYSYSMRRDPFELQSLTPPPKFEISIPQGTIRLSHKEYLRILKQTHQFYAISSKIEDHKSQFLFGFGPEYLGFSTNDPLIGKVEEKQQNKMMNMENLFAILHGKSRKGIEAFVAKLTMTTSEDHKVWFRDDWVKKDASNNLEKEKTQVICSRPGVNHVYGYYKGERLHDYQDYVAFNRLESTNDFEHFSNFLCYMFWLDFCAYEELGIQCPSVPDIGCGNFAPDQKREKIRKATADAFLFVLENFPFRNVKSLIITAYADSYSAFHDAFLDYVGPIPVAICDRDMMTLQLLGDRFGVSTSLLNAADSHRIPGEWWVSDMRSVEECLAKSTTLVLTQHPDLNPRYALNKDNFLGFDLSSVVDYLFELRHQKMDRNAFKLRFRTMLDEAIDRHKKQREELEKNLVERQLIVDHLNALMEINPKIFNFRLRANMVEKSLENGCWIVRFEKNNKDTKKLLDKLSKVTQEQPIESKSDFYDFLLLTSDILPSNNSKK